MNDEGLFGRFVKWLIASVQTSDFWLVATIPIIAICLFFGSLIYEPVFPHRDRSEVVHSRYIFDHEKLLTTKHLLEIEESLSRLYREYGHDILVVTLPSLSGHSAEAVSHSIVKRWEVGKRVQERGMLILLSRAERQSSVYFGPSFKRKSIVEHIGVSDFSERDVSAYINEVIQRIELAEPRSYVTAYMSGLCLGLMCGIFIIKYIGSLEVWWMFGVLGGGFGMIFHSFLIAVLCGVSAYFISIFVLQPRWRELATINWLED